MNNGFIYVLINESFKGLIKIGKTTVSSVERARQLSNSTGVPTPFKVAYEIYSEDCNGLEKEIHLELHDFRVNPNREFFNYPLNKAIELIQRLSKGQEKTDSERFESIEILHRLQQMFGDFLNPNVSSAKIYQTTDRVYLEVTQDNFIADYLKDQHITRTDLGFVVNGYDVEDKTFKPSRSINMNVEEFLSSGFTTMDVCSDILFTKEAEDQVYNKQLEIYQKQSSEIGGD